MKTTVKELKALLDKFPDDLRVIVTGYEGGLEDIGPDSLQARRIIIGYNGLAARQGMTFEERKTKLPNEMALHIQRGKYNEGSCNWYQGEHEKVEDKK